MIPLSIPSPPSEWSSFTIGFFTIHVYALAILLGIVVALLITNHRLTRRGGEPWIIIDLTFWGLLLGVIGTRIWHVATHVDDYFGPGKDLIKVLWIWEGGLAIFGGLLGGALGYFIGARIQGLRFLSVADALVPGLLVAQALGRLGNYFNQELFGLPTDLPWGLQIDRPNVAIPTGLSDKVLFHPTFLYEMIWNLVGVFLIVFVIENVVSVVRSGRFPRIVLTRRAFWQWGKVVGLYLIWYGIGRTWLESIRLDPSETFLGVRSNVWGALGAIVLGIVIIAVQTRRHPGLEPGVYVPGKQWTDPSEVDSADTYSDTDDGDVAAAEEGSNKPQVPATSGTSRTS